MAFFDFIKTSFDVLKKKPSDSIDTNNYSMDMANNPNVAISTTADNEDTSMLLSNKKRSKSGVSSNLGIQV